MNRLLVLCIWLCSVVFVGHPAHAQYRFTVSGDTDYYVVDAGPYRIIYSKEYRPLISQLKNYTLIFKEIYEKEFNWILDERETIVLTSSQNQVANGFATVLPRLQTVFYNGSGDIVDEMSVQSWLYTLVSHETSHLYQLNAKQGYSKFLKEILGNSNIDGSAFLPPFTYTMHPNVFLPTFALEGNATYNEGRFGAGGRLYNGAIRSLFLQQIQAGQINPKRMMNDHLDFPYTREKYWAGGYLFLDIAEHVGTERVNQFFLEHADYNANPLQLNEPFQETFGFSYNKAFENLNMRWSALAQKQVHAKEAALFISDQHTALTSNGDEILTMTTTNKRLPQTRILNRKSREWSVNTVNMPFGRLLRDDSGELVAASAEATSTDALRAGLFRDGFSFDEKYLNKNYYDKQGADELWVDAQNSLYAPHLYLNRTDLGYVASSGIIHQGQAYFFKQQQKTRTLYRGDKPVFSYRGYYGFPIGVVDDAIYFVGPAERGSSLYIWQGGQFARMHSSDIIVDAKLIDAQSALIVELTLEGYAYKIVSLEKMQETPYEYIYFYEKDKLFETFKDLAPPLVTSKIDDETQVEGERPYSTMGDLQFDGIDPMLFFGVDTLVVAQAVVRFSDPLQNHGVNALLGSGSFGEAMAGLQYVNAEHVINWDILGLYQRRAEVEEDTSVSSDDNDRWIIEDRYDTWIAAAGVQSVFFRRPQIASALSSHFVYEYENPHILLSDTDKKYTLLTQLDWGYSVNPPLGYKEYKMLAFDIDHEYVQTAPEWQNDRNVFGGQATGRYDIFRETYLAASYQTAVTDSRYAIIPLKVGPGDFPYPSVTRIQRNTSFYDLNYFELSKFSAEFTQAFNWSFYFTKVPLALRRFALIAEYNEYYGATVKDASPETLFHETGAGAELEILFFHRFPMRVRYMHYESNFDDESASIFTAGMNKSF